MKIGMQWRNQLLGAGPAGKYALEEFQSLIAQLTGWATREHNDEGGHGSVTAQSVTITSLRETALKVAAGLSHLDGGVAMSKAITPPTITSDQNDYSPPGIKDAFILRLQTDDERIITGIQDGPRMIPVPGRLMLVFNAGTSNVVLAHEDIGSRPNFRFRLPGSRDAIVSPNNCVLLVYDRRARRWIMLARTSGDGQRFSEFDAGESGANVTIDWANGTQQILTLTANANITLVNGVEGVEYHLLLVQNAVGGWVPSFEPNVLFENDDLTPEALEPFDVLRVELWYSAYNGGTYFAFYTPWETDLLLENLEPAPSGDLLLGRDVGAGDWEPIAVGAGLTLASGILSAAAAASGDVVGPSSSVDSEIALFDGTTGKLLKRATGTGIVKATSGGYGTGQVSLTSEVTGDLPYANLAPASAASRMLGRGSAGGAGDWEEITLGSGLAMVGTVLSSTGGGVGGSGAWTHIDTWDQAIDGTVASFDFDVTGYEEVLLLFYAVTASSSGQRAVRVSTDGVNFLSGAADYVRVDPAGTVATSSTFAVHDTSSTAARYGQMVIKALSLNGVKKPMFPHNRGVGGFCDATTSPIVAVRVLNTAGNLNGGTITVLAR
jgi:hypothetical protein